MAGVNIFQIIPKYWAVEPWSVAMNYLLGCWAVVGRYELSTPRRQRFGDLLQAAKKRQSMQKRSPALVSGRSNNPVGREQSLPRRPAQKLTYISVSNNNLIRSYFQSSR